METNPYAPPKAHVADIADFTRNQAAPPLWNPNAAANWSLLFSPVFGAFLHMKNWQALGEPEKASAAKVWVIVGLVMFVTVALASGFFPAQKWLDALSRAVAIGLLVSWYFASARHQTAYVKSRFGTAYPRRAWSKPLLLAVLAIIGFVVALAAVGFVVGAVFGVV